MTLNKTLIIITLMTICFALKSQEIQYYTTKPIVLRGIPNKINFLESPNFDSIMVFSDNDRDVVCIENGQLYYLPFHYKEGRIFIATEINGDRVVHDTLEFIIENIDFDKLDFHTAKNRRHSGYTIATDSNRIEYHSPNLYRQFNLENFLQIQKISIRVVAEKNGQSQLDTVLNFDSDTFFFFPLIMGLPGDSQIYMELQSVEFSGQNLPCGLSYENWPIALKTRKIFDIN